jgi:hypothetical protein
MAPLPVQLSTAVACTGIPASTLSTFYLTAHTSAPSHISPVAIPCHTDSMNYKRWLGSSVISHRDDDGWKTVGDDDNTSDQITVEETPVGEPAPTTDEDGKTVDDDDNDLDNEIPDEPKTTVEESSPDEPMPPTTGEDDNENAGWKTVGDESTHNKTSVGNTTMPVEPAGTEASADTITSELVEKYGIMPTSIDDCINTEDEIVTYTDENGNNNVTVNCTALVNMETWYFLPCDVECHDDLEEIIPGVVVGSGLSGGLLPTILNNHGLWSNNPVSQTAVFNWLTNHLQRVRSLLSTDAFDWTRVQSNAEELMDHPPVDLPLENDAFSAPESVPEVATPEAIEAAEAAVEEAKNALENLRYMTKNPHAIEAAEDHLAEKQEALRQLKKNARPAEVPSEEGAPSDPVDPVDPVDPAESAFSAEEIAAWTQKLKDAVRAVKEAMRNYTSIRGNPRIPRRMQLARKAEWMEAKKAVKAIRDHIHERGLPIDDIPELEEPVRFAPDPEAEAAKQAAKEANNALRATRKLTQDEEVIQALEEAAQNAADVARYHKNNVYDVRPRQTVEQAQNQLNWVREVSRRGEDRLRAIDEHLQNMIDATPDFPPELVQSFQRGLDTIQRLKQSTQAYMAKVAKDLLKAERALKRANGDLKVTWPEDPVEGEQPHPYGPDRTYDGTHDDEWYDVDENKDGEEPTEGEEPVKTDKPTETDEPTETNESTENEPTENDKPTEHDEPTETGEWHDADENKEGEESTESDQPTETDEPTEVSEPTKPDETTEPDQKPDSDEPTETTEKTGGDEETEVEKPSETSEPKETDEETEVNEPTETEETSNGDEPSGDGESIEIEVLPSGGGAPIVPPGVVPPVIVPIPGIGDVLAPTKVLQKAAEELKNAADWLLGLNDKDDDKKDHKAIKKAEKKIKEAKKKLKKEQEKEKKKQEKENKKKDKADKKDKEDEKTTTVPPKGKATSTSTSSSKTPEPTVHHKQHEAEITFHGEHKHKFELYGKDWARGKNDADELHSNMEKCGMEIKDWEFSYADKKPEIKTSDWSFYAKGEFLRKTAADVRCLNKAIHDANGPKDLISETDGVDKASDAPEKAEVAAQVTFSEKHFTLFGKGFAKDKDAGEKLKEKMAKCSKVKDWKFCTQKKDHDMELKEQGWDFYAEGEVKEVKRKCLNEAIQGVGGPEEAIADGDV